jgi:Protein of unknown function (DUF1524)
MSASDLDKTDEPQAIFETLNAHGTPLLPADLMKNWLLWEASRQRQNIARLYTTYWQPFDKEPNYWRANVGTGHAARARVDTFLQNWLTRRTREMVSTKHLYDKFLKHVAPINEQSPKKCDVPSLMADIRDNSLRFRAIDTPAGKTRFDAFLRRVGVMDVVVFHPVLLALLGRPGSDDADRDAVATIFESYLVRRMVCGEQTRGYGAIGLALLEVIEGVRASAPVAAKIKEHLASSTGADWWPDDATFKQHWRERRFYGGLRRQRVVMVLQALEEFYQRASSKGEPIVQFNFSQLEIEHILPQEWEAHWALSPDDPLRAGRNLALHRIGNLTLVSGKLNPSLSHAAWLNRNVGGKTKFGKRRALEEHSKLQLNARLVKTYPERWNETCMDARALELFKVALQVWPGPPPGSGSKATPAKRSRRAPTLEAP